MLFRDDDSVLSLSIKILLHFDSYLSVKYTNDSKIWHADLLSRCGSRRKRVQFVQWNVTRAAEGFPITLKLRMRMGGAAVEPA